ncbi:MAG: hypothetical protein GY714_23145 [Desulfobacterales bacterium]|nr:hypothetical protein [Desulfobacterales bacterium]
MDLKADDIFIYPPNAEVKPDVLQERIFSDQQRIGKGIVFKSNGVIETNRQPLGVIDLELKHIEPVFTINLRRAIDSKFVPPIMPSVNWPANEKCVKPKHIFKNIQNIKKKKRSLGSISGLGESRLGESNEKVIVLE